KLVQHDLRDTLDGKRRLDVQLQAWWGVAEIWQGILVLACIATVLFGGMRLHGVSAAQVSACLLTLVLVATILFSAATEAQTRLRASETLRQTAKFGMSLDDQALDEKRVDPV